MMNEQKHLKFIYGPVSSWRIGRSLGVDLISSSKKVCTFDCAYCQAGEKTACSSNTITRAPLGKILDELRHLTATGLDYITFSGMGEPTLAANLRQAIREIKKIRKEPIAILTNSSLLSKLSVRNALLQADFVICKLDAYSQESLEAINRPSKEIKFDKIVKAIKDFKSRFKGKLALQIMFIRENKGAVNKFKKLILYIRPDEVQVNTPLRPSVIKPLSRKDIKTIVKELSGLKNTKIVSVYESKRKNAHALNKLDTIRRRGAV